jgi:hypothetical protein
MFASCERATPWPGTGVFTGYYLAGFEKSDFKPAGSRERWWLGGNTDKVRTLFVAPSSTERPQATGPIYIIVRGELSPEGHYGHLGRYKRELSVQEVLEFRLLKPAESVAF